MCCRLGLDASCDEAKVGNRQGRALIDPATSSIRDKKFRPWAGVWGLFFSLGCRGAAKPPRMTRMKRTCGVNCTRMTTSIALTCSTRPHGLAEQPLSTMVNTPQAPRDRTWQPSNHLRT